MTPWSTPHPLALLLIATAVLSTGVAFTDTALASFYSVNFIDWWLGLSAWGWSQYYIWQPLSHLFIFPSYGTLTVSYLIQMAFLLYTLWIMGAELCERMGARSFVTAYLAIGAIAGLIVIVLAPGSSLLEGPSASLLATLTLWTMLGPYSEVLLFLLFPIQRRWLFVAVCASLLLINAASGYWGYLLWYICGILGGYLYGTMSWQLIGPLPCTSPLDKLLYRFSSYLQGLWARATHQPAAAIASKPKVFDFRTGQPVLDDDAFVDAMLAKIAKHGEEVLSWDERKRLEEISEKKRK